MVHDGQPVKSNQFIFKAVLINTMFAMHAGGSGRMTEMKATQIQHTLNEIFKAQIAYAEGDRNHPFLEEVV